jgi:carboxyl-terminal processing protease
LQREKMRALVLDLRFNPGGLLSEAVGVSDLFIDRGRIVSTKGRNSPEQTWEAHAAGTFKDFPMAVLVNRYSASASEIVAACLQDHRRAAIVGQRTWGKGSVQTILELENGGSALKLTTASYIRPSGKNIHRFPDAKESDTWGVTPDEGYGLKLDDRETVSLLDAQRQRDALRRPEQGEKEKPFVDRQLDLAVKHVTGELERKK